jgi:hypothetical protein
MVFVDSRLNCGVPFLSMMLWRLQHYMSGNGVESKLYLMDFLHDSAVMAAKR